MYLHCSKNHLNCTNRLNPKEVDDLTNSTGLEGDSKIRKTVVMVFLCIS